MTDSPGITGPVAATLAGVTYRQIHYWTVCGYLRPIRGGGSGHDDTYPMTEIRVAARIRTLREAGIDLDVAAAAARTMIEDDVEVVTITNRVSVRVD